MTTKTRTEIPKPRTPKTPKTTWKELHLMDRQQIRHLKAYQACSNEFAAYTIQYEEGATSLETNMPWYLLRKWFSFAGIPMPRNILTADKPSWEIYQD